MHQHHRDALLGIATALKALTEAMRADPLSADALACSDDLRAKVDALDVELHTHSPNDTLPLSVDQYMTAMGFDTMGTGGNCMAYRYAPAGEGGPYGLLCDEDTQLPTSFYERAYATAYTDADDDIGIEYENTLPLTVAALKAAVDSMCEAER